MQDALGGQSLASIYSVYEKLKGKTGAAADAKPAGSTSQPAEPTTASKSSPTPESDKLKSEGNAAMGRKDYAAAIDLYSQALGVAPSNPIYLSNRAAAYSASGDHAKAAIDAEIALTVDPKYARAWSRLGLAKYELGDAKGAVEAYEKGIEAEGNGGSDAMKRGLETSQRKVEEMKRAESAPPSEDVDNAPGASRGAAGGMPDLSALAGMMGGGGGGGGMPDLSSIMSNPMFANMAQNLMSNPDMLNNIMSNPRLRQMAENFGVGGGGGSDGSDGSGGGMPDMSSLMSDPSIAEM